MQVLPGHRLAAADLHSADPGSRASRIQHQIHRNQEATASKTFAYTEVILGKPWPAANNKTRSNGNDQLSCRECYGESHHHHSREYHHHRKQHHT